jgi:hypothetical protein
VEHWLFSLLAGLGLLVLSAASVAGSGTRARELVGGLVTLLGPEGTGTGFSGVGCLQALAASFAMVGGWGCGVRAGPASIPHHTPWGLFVGVLVVGGGVGLVPFVF